MRHKPRVYVIGGGVRGASIAALLAESRLFGVTLLEKNLLGSGITSLNHGRLHSGATLWRRATQASDEELLISTIIRRRLRGAELIRQSMPDCFDQSKSAVYLAHNDLAKAFKEACAHYGIPTSEDDVDIVSNDWIHPSLTDWTAVGVREYAFLPTQLTLRLVVAASAAGALVLPNQSVHSITHNGGTLVIKLADQSVHDADAILNATNGSATINCELNQHLDPPLEYSYPAIRLLLARDGALLPPLNRPITVIEPENLVPTVIPHTGAFVFHADVPVTTVMGSPRCEPSRCESKTDMSFLDESMISVCSRFFPPFARRAVMNQVECVSGIYPRLQHLHPSRPFRVHSMLDKSLYWVVSGGNATTTLLDACETVEAMLRTMDYRYNIRENVAEWFIRLLTNMGVHRRSDAFELLVAKMFWE